MENFILFFYSNRVMELSKEQIEGTLGPLARILGLNDKPKVIHDGPIKYSKSDAEEYGIHEYGSIAKQYKLEQYTDKNGESFYFLIVVAPAFKKNTFLACEYFNHFLTDVKKVSRPHVYILPNFEISDSLFKKINSNIVSVPYRLVPIQKIYPLLFTPKGVEMNRLMTYDYELLQTKEMTFSNLDWPLIKDSDPGAIIVNALPGELIRCKRTILDGMTPYSEYEIRRVYKTKNDIGEIADSGVDGLDDY